MPKGNSIFQEDEEVGGEMTRLSYAQIAFEFSKRRIQRAKVAAKKAAEEAAEEAKKNETKRMPPAVTVKKKEECVDQ
ncbi:hypothetical protein DAPPUDRAFT_258566 [Daphnia pulex]|uniref:Uncharacterized protein n=1 Tax=Daphnia pulex TaxID=6669 RepID=E9HFL5_DAPPU|nr:hypothetical protein DAPPUDRAFT_258566 [Daphnia pulex]|eukprot:EFX69451.1 hypothetical protein DAPPUDRAFT_258566 [Daphnia pulex]